MQRSSGDVPIVFSGMSGERSEISRWRLVASGDGPFYIDGHLGQNFLAARFLIGHGQVFVVESGISEHGPGPGSVMEESSGNGSSVAVEVGI